jgi:hypothetical protein
VSDRTLWLGENAPRIGGATHLGHRGHNPGGHRESCHQECGASLPRPGEVLVFVADACKMHT